MLALMARVRSCMVNLGREIMTVRSILFGTALVLAAAVGTVQAGDALSTLAAVPAENMTSEQMAKVRGAAHIRNLVGRAGVSVPAAAFDALGAAGCDCGTSIVVINAQLLP